MRKTRRISIKFWLAFIACVQFALALIGIPWLYVFTHEPGRMFYLSYVVVGISVINACAAFCTASLCIEYANFSRSGIKKKE